jgi:hypothetical protein
MRWLFLVAKRGVFAADNADLPPPPKRTTRAIPDS